MLRLAQPIVVLLDIVLVLLQPIVQCCVFVGGGVVDSRLDHGGGRGDVAGARAVRVLVAVVVVV